MAEIQNEIRLPDEYQDIEYGKEVISNLRSLVTGADDKIIVQDKEGSRWGADNFDDAPAWIKIDGAARFENAVIKGTLLAGSSVVAGDITSGGTIEGVNIISSDGDNSIRLTDGDDLEFYKLGTRTGLINTIAGDLSLVGVDDVLFSAGGSVRCGVHGTAFRPETTAGDYELGTAEYPWEKVHSKEFDIGSNWKITESTDTLFFKYGATEYLRINGNKIRPAGAYESSDGSDGLTKNDTMVTWVWRESDGDLKQTYREVAWKDGILTTWGSTIEDKICTACT